jgi:hypothetical protein
VLKIHNDLSIELLVLVQKMNGFYCIKIKLAQIVAIHHADLIMLRFAAAPHLCEKLEIGLMPLVALVISSRTWLIEVWP